MGMSFKTKLSPPESSDFQCPRVHTQQLSATVSQVISSVVVIRWVISELGVKPQGIYEYISRKILLHPNLLFSLGKFWACDKCRIEPYMTIGILQASISAVTFYPQQSTACLSRLNGFWTLECLLLYIAVNRKVTFSNLVRKLQWRSLFKKVKMICLIFKLTCKVFLINTLNTISISLKYLKVFLCTLTVSFFVFLSVNSY